MSGGIGMLTIIPSVLLWIFHFGRVWWSWNEVYRETLHVASAFVSNVRNVSNGWTLGGHMQVTVLYPPTKFEVIRTSSIDPRVIFLFGRVYRSWKEYISKQENVSLPREYFTWEGVLVLKGLNYETVNRRLHWACYWILGGCMLLVAGLGGSDVWLGTEGSTSHTPLLLYWETFMPFG